MEKDFKNENCEDVWTNFKDFKFRFEKIMDSINNRKNIRWIMKNQNFNDINGDLCSDYEQLKLNFKRLLATITIY